MPSFRPICILLLFALLFQGCGKNGPTLKLLVWISKEDRPALDRQLEEFSRENGKSHVEVVAVATMEECREEFQRRLLRGNAPDVCMISASDLPLLLQNKQVCDLAPYHPDEKPFLPEAWKTFLRDGKLYALPCGWSTLALYYNKTIFERHGFRCPRSSWDWGDLALAAQALTVVDEASGKTAQYGLELSPAVERWAPFLWQNQGELIRPDGDWALIDPQYSQSACEAVGFYADLVREHHVAPLPAKGKWREQDGALFLKGKAAMTMAPRGYGSRLQQGGNFTWEVAQLPRRSQNASLFEVFGYAIPSSCRQPELAWKLASFLGRETGQAAMIQQGSYAPAWRSLLQSKLFLDFPGPRAADNSVFVISLSFARTTPAVPYWDKASAILSEEMLTLMSSPTLDVRDSVEKMQGRLEELKLLKEKGVQPPPAPPEPRKPVVAPKITPPVHQR